MGNQLSLLRAAWSLIAGAIVAASAWSLMIFLPAGKYEASMLLGYALAALVWLVGLIVFAVPVWTFLHRKGMRSLAHAIVVGLVLGFVVSFGLATEGFGVLSGRDVGYNSEFGDAGGTILKDGILTSYGWWEAAKDSALIALASAIAAAAVWRIAYYQKPSF